MNKICFVISAILFKILTFLIIVSSSTSTFAQQKVIGEISAPNSIVFKDSIHGWATDSIVHNVGVLPPVNIKLIKYFKYTGNDMVTITNAWTGDPHFICHYPKTPLIKGKIYSFTVCFWFQDRQGKFTKVMGFDLSNGQRISYEFKGDIQQQNSIQQH